MPMTDATTITREDNGTHGAYRIALEGAARPAELTWRGEGSAEKPVRVAESTFVPPEGRGKGVAMQLVEALVADAREQGFTIRPSCSYVVTAFARNPQWAEVQAR